MHPLYRYALPLRIFIFGCSNNVEPNLFKVLVARLNMSRICILT